VTRDEQPSPKHAKSDFYFGGIRAYLASSWSTKKGIRKYIGPKRVIALLGLAGLFFLGRVLQGKGLLSPALLQNYLDQYPATSVIAFIGIYIASVVAALPTLPLNLAAGYFWGGLLGGLIATAGSSLGAVLAFLVARIALGQPLARRFDHRIVAWIQGEFELQNWRFIAFVRINPVFPTGLLNYIFGLTSIRVWTYIWATVAFLCPPSIIIAVIGDQAGTFLLNKDVRDSVRALLIISAAVTLFVAIKYVSRLRTETRLPK
jgi:uncharacterized membrane protein YdjX (TVP38/TMEM64 family)